MAGEEFLGKDALINLEKNDIEIGTNNDFKIRSFNENLKQAIIIRLRTRVGELRRHPLYGSLLPDLIGRSGNDSIINLAKMYIREALLQEPRIESIDKISVRFGNQLKNVLEIDLEITPIEDNEPLNIVFPYFL